MLSTDPIVEKYLGLALENKGTPFTYNDTKFIDISFLYDFIKKNHKEVELIDFEEVIKEVLDVAYSGTETYELGSTETKTGNPATISFEYTYDYNADDDALSNETIEF